MRQRFVIGSVLGWGLLCSLPSQQVGAAVTSILAEDSGFYNAAGRTAKNDGLVLGAIDATYNYSAGAIDEAAPLAGMDVPRKNYFVFDLTGVTEDITAAALELYNPSGGYSSPDPTEDYVISGVPAASLPEMATLSSEISMTYSILDAGELASATALYGALAGIPAFGSVTVSAADDDSMVTVALDPAGVDYLNMFKGGKVVLSGFLATLDAVDAGDEVIFGFTKPVPDGAPDPGITAPTPTPLLHIDTVPEPSSMALLALGGVIMFKRRRQHFLD